MAFVDLTFVQFKHESVLFEPVQFLEIPEPDTDGFCQRFLHVFTLDCEEQTFPFIELLFEIPDNRSIRSVPTRELPLVVLVQRIYFRRRHIPNTCIRQFYALQNQFLDQLLRPLVLVLVFQPEHDQRVAGLGVLLLVRVLLGVSVHQLVTHLVRVVQCLVVEVVLVVRVVVDVWGAGEQPELLDDCVVVGYDFGVIQSVPVLAFGYGLAVDMPHQFYEGARLQMRPVED